MARILVSHRYPPPGDPTCHTIVLGSRTLRPSRWLNVNVDVIGHNQHGFSLPAHPGATSLDSRCMLPRSLLLLPRSLFSLSLTLCFVCYYTCTTLCFCSRSQTLLFSFYHSRPIDLLTPSCCITLLVSSLLMAKSHSTLLPCGILKPCARNQTAGSSPLHHLTPTQPRSIWYPGSDQMKIAPAVVGVADCVRALVAQEVKIGAHGLPPW